MLNSVDNSDGVSYSDGVFSSDGVSSSRGVSYSEGVSYGYGVKESKGVYKSIFGPKKEVKPTIFGNEVNEKRFNEVMNKLKSFNWYPKANNALDLYKANGDKWDFDARKILKKGNMWEGMPQEMIDYIKSLPEFDEELFKWHIGIDVSNENSKKKEAILKKIEELKQEADNL